MWIGIDDTDSKKGMCTTYLMAVLVEKLVDSGMDIIGYPRLVRLNPSIPWKTRGNAALAVQIGEGNGKRHMVSRIGEKVIYGYDLDSDLPGGCERISDIVSRVVEEYAEMEDEGTNPGIVITEKKPPISFYKKAVQDVVDIEEAEQIIKDIGAKVIRYKNGRGIIGALAAIAWEHRNKTYEIITYRKKERIGRERYVEPESVIRMDEAYQDTFDNYDYENREARIAPHTPCPILFGIRGINPELEPAAKIIKSEPVERWILYESNQASDDHLMRRRINEVRPFLSSIVSGRVSRNPYEITGGHVFFKIKDETGELECAAYEPTKQFRNIIRKLREGDEITVFGSTRDERLTLNLEKLSINRLAEVFEKIENPLCICGRRMHSKGKEEYRCPSCGKRLPKGAARFRKIERNLKEGWYEVPPVARRHLSRPLKLGTPQ